MNGARSKQHRTALREFEAETKQTATMEEMGWRCIRRERPSQMPTTYQRTWTGQDKVRASVSQVGQPSTAGWRLTYYLPGAGSKAETFPTPVAAAMYLQFLMAQQPATTEIVYDLEEYCVNDVKSLAFYGELTEVNHVGNR